MKFGKKLLSEAEPEWAAFYVQYADLKRDIKEIEALRQQQQQHHHHHKHQHRKHPHKLSHNLNSPPSPTTIRTFHSNVARQVHFCVAFFRERLRELESGVSEAQRTARLIYNEAASTLPRSAAASSVQGSSRVQDRSRSSVLLNKENLLLENIRLGEEAVRLFNWLRLNSEATHKILKKFKKRVGASEEAALPDVLEEDASLANGLALLKESHALLQPCIDAITLAMSQLLGDLSAQTDAYAHPNPNQTNPSQNEHLQHLQHLQQQRSMPALAKAQGLSAVSWIRLEQLRQRAQGIQRDCDGMRARMASADGFLSYMSRSALIAPSAASAAAASERQVRWGSSIHSDNFSIVRTLSSIESSPPAVQQRVLR